MTTTPGEGDMTAGRARPVEPAVLPIDDPRWWRFVDERSEAGPFHHPAWARVLADSYGRPAFAVVALDANGAVVAGAPMIEVRTLRFRRWISLPYTDSCHPLGNASDVERLGCLIEPLRCLEGVDAVEIHAPVAWPTARLGHRGFSHVLPLASDASAVRKTFNRSQVERGITRAEREGVTVRRGAGADDLLGVFYALHLSTRRRQGVPIQPRRFFELLWERVLEPGLGFVLISEHAGRPVAAAVFLVWKSSMVYKFGASDPTSWGVRPNHALFWAAIREGCELGLHRLDFGRTDRGNDGLRTFKRSWGTLESELVYAQLGVERRAGEGRSSRLLATAIRHSPPSLCRIVGEHLYRYAA